MMNLGIVEILIVLGILGILAFLAVAIFIALFATRRPKQENAPQNAREILDQRYARGELSREQYEQMRRDLEN
jgi:putative membrane protein